MQEILAVCPNCYIQAALATYRVGNLQQAVQFCTRSVPEQQFSCLSRLFDIALDENRLDEAEELCWERQGQDMGGCLRPLALKWADTNDHYAVSLCNKIDPDDARRFGCLLDVALVVKPQNQERALQICTQLGGSDGESCRQEVMKE